MKISRNILILLVLLFGCNINRKIMATDNRSIVGCWQKVNQNNGIMFDTAIICFDNVMSYREYKIDSLGIVSKKNHSDFIIDLMYYKIHKDCLILSWDKRFTNTQYLRILMLTNDSLEIESIYGDDFTFSEKYVPYNFSDSSVLRDNH